MTDVTLRATGHWLGTRTGAGGAATPTRFFFFLLQPVDTSTAGSVPLATNRLQVQPSTLAHRSMFGFLRKPQLTSINAENNSATQNA